MAVPGRCRRRWDSFGRPGRSPGPPTCRAGGEGRGGERARRVSRVRWRGGARQAGREADKPSLPAGAPSPLPAAWARGATAAAATPPHCHPLTAPAPPTKHAPLAVQPVQPALRVGRGPGRRQKDGICHDVKAHVAVHVGGGVGRGRRHRACGVGTRVGQAGALQGCGGVAAQRGLRQGVQRCCVRRATAARTCSPAAPLCTSAHHLRLATTAGRGRTGSPRRGPRLKPVSASPAHPPPPPGRHR